MYAKKPDENQLKAFGFELSDFSANTAEIWECNQEAAGIFADLGTQWRVGFGGAVGLDYAAVAAVFDVYGIEQHRRRTLLEDIRVMEAAALDEMYRGSHE